MKKFFKYFFVLLSFFLLINSFVAFSDQFLSKRTYDYKMTISIETPEGVKVGTWIQHVQARGFVGSEFPPHGGKFHIDWIETGAVDLGSKGKVVIDKSRFADGIAETIGRSLADKKVGEKVYLRKQQPPVLMLEGLFWDRDLFVVKELATTAPPYRAYQIITDVFEDVLGKGYRLKSITIERLN